MSDTYVGPRQDIKPWPNDFMGAAIASGSIVPPQAEIDEIVWRKRYMPLVRVGLVLSALTMMSIASWAAWAADTRCYQHGKEWVCENSQQRTTCWQQGKEWKCRTE